MCNEYFAIRAGNVVSEEKAYFGRRPESWVNTFADGTVQTKQFHANGREVTTQPDGTVIDLQETPDPRFGMDAPVPQSLTVQTPDGLTSTTTAARAASLATPGDTLSLQSLTEITTVNGNAYRSVYNATTKTFTYTSPEGRTGMQTINTQARPVRTQISGLGNPEIKGSHSMISAG